MSEVRAIGVANHDPEPIVAKSVVNWFCRAIVVGTLVAQPYALPYASRLSTRPPLASVPSDCQPLFALAMSGPPSSCSWRLSVELSCPQSSDVRLIVTLGCFFWKAATAASIHLPSAEPQKSVSLSVTLPAAATSVETDVGVLAAVGALPPG